MTGALEPEPADGVARSGVGGSRGGDRWHAAAGAGVRLAADVARRAAVLADWALAPTFLGAARAERPIPTDGGGTLYTVPLTAGVSWTC